MGTKIYIKCTNSYLLGILGFSVMADSDVLSVVKKLLLHERLLQFFIIDILGASASCIRRDEICLVNTSHYL
jgi:hypothetical protein